MATSDTESDETFYNNNTTFAIALALRMLNAQGAHTPQWTMHDMIADCSLGAGPRVEPGGGRRLQSRWVHAIGPHCMAY